MNVPNQFSFTRWFSAGFAFGLGFVLAVLLICSAFVFGVGGFLLKKGVDAVSKVASKAMSDAKPMEPLDGVYLVSTNTIRRGDSIVVEGAITNSSGSTIRDLFMWADLSGSTNGVMVYTENIDSLEVGELKTVSCVFDGAGAGEDEKAMTLDIEFSKQTK